MEFTRHQQQFFGAAVEFSSNANSVVNFSSVPKVMICVLEDAFKLKLTANKDFFIRSDGSNSNSGTVDSSGGAWLTLEYALAFIANDIDFQGFQINLTIGAGTFRGLDQLVFRQ